MADTVPSPESGSLLWLFAQLHERRFRGIVLPSELLAKLSRRVGQLPTVFMKGDKDDVLVDPLAPAIVAGGADAEPVVVAAVTADERIQRADYSFAAEGDGRTSAELGTTMPPSQKMTHCGRAF